MWKRGKISLPSNNSIAEYEAKVFADDSEYGIDGGKISKLTVKIDGKTVINYDRGWDLNPDENNESLMCVYNEIIKKYN